MSRRKEELKDLEQFYEVVDSVPKPEKLFDRDIKLEKKRKNHRMGLPSSKQIMKRIFRIK